MRHASVEIGSPAVAAKPWILIATATYNEIENLPTLVDEVLRHAPQADVLVIDDNSPDGTGKWCQARAESEPRLRLLARAGKQGQGSAIVAAMRHAVDEGYDFLVTMDADFSHQPRYVPALVERICGRCGSGPDVQPVDVAIGSRYVAGGGIEGWPWRRHLMSRAVNLYARLLLRLPVRDCSGGYRAYRVDLLRSTDLSGLVSTGYSFHEEILWRLNHSGCRFAEVPITFVDRTRGQTKINLREAWNAVRIIFRLGLRERFGRR